MSGRMTKRSRNIKNILIKSSGDVAESRRFISFVRRKARNNYVVVVCGGGTKISEAFQKAGHPIRFDEIHGRITETWEERKLARDILEQEEQNLQDAFVGRGVVVMAPIIYAGSVLYHINGDNLVKLLAPSFDEAYVFTTTNRRDKKVEQYRDYPKIQVIGI